MRAVVAVSVLLVVTAACGDSGGGLGGGASGSTGASPTSGSASGPSGGTSGTSGTTTTTTTAGAGSSTSGGAGFDPVSIDLCSTINAYRAEQGLAAIPVSVSLMTVAAAHVADLDAHPDVVAGECNLHSWSSTSADFSGCCYTPDHAQAACMWDKPRELTDYTGNGYEIAASGTPTPESALTAWQGSPPHHEVILNAGTWQMFSPWPAMGCAIRGAYAVVWFGDAVDPLTL